MINFLLFLVWIAGLVGAVLLEANAWYSALGLLVSMAAGIIMAKRSGPEEDKHEQEPKTS